MSTYLCHERNSGYITGLLISFLLLMTGLLQQKTEAAAPGTVITVEWSEPGDFYIKLKRVENSTALSEPPSGTLYICDLTGESQYRLPHHFRLNDSDHFKFSASSQQGLVQICLHERYSVNVAPGYNTRLPEGKVICSNRGKSTTSHCYPLTSTISTDYFPLKPEEDNTALLAFKALQSHHSQRLQNRFAPECKTNQFTLCLDSLTNNSSILKGESCEFANAFEPVAPEKVTTTTQTDPAITGYDSSLDAAAEALKAKLQIQPRGNCEEELSVLLTHIFKEYTYIPDTSGSTPPESDAAITLTGTLYQNSTPADTRTVGIRLYDPLDEKHAERYQASCKTVLAQEAAGNPLPFPTLITSWTGFGLHIQILYRDRPATRWKPFPTKTHSFEKCLPMLEVLLNALNQLHQQSIRFCHISPATIAPDFSRKDFTEPVFRTITADLAQITEGKQVGQVVREDLDSVLKTLFYLRAGKTLKEHWQLFSDQEVDPEQAALKQLHACPRDQWLNWMAECSQVVSCEEELLITQFCGIDMDWTSADHLRKLASELTEAVNKKHQQDFTITTEMQDRPNDHFELSQHTFLEEPPLHQYCPVKPDITSSSSPSTPSVIINPVPNKATEVASGFRLTCECGHLLLPAAVRSIKDHGSDLYCDGCPEDKISGIKISSGYVMRCRDCRYHLCSECCLRRIKLPALLPVKVKCKNNHLARLVGGGRIKETYGCSAYSCDGRKCKFRDTVQTLHYRCDTCYENEQGTTATYGFDLCLSCGLQAPVPPRCDQGHLMEEVTTKNFYNCDSLNCRRQITKREQRHQCRECCAKGRQYNLCMRCSESRIKYFETKKALNGFRGVTPAASQATLK